MSLLAWPVGLFATIFMFDAPGSEISPLTLALAAAILVYPLPIVVGAWGFWRHRNTESTEVLARFTFVSLSSPAFLAAIAWAFEAFCQGQFVCH